MFVKKLAFSKIAGEKLCENQDKNLFHCYLIMLEIDQILTNCFSKANLKPCLISSEVVLDMCSYEKMF